MADVLGRSESAQELVVEAAEDLSSINSALKQELTEHDSAPGVEEALVKSEAVEAKVNDASEQLSSVNLALKQEVGARHALEDLLDVVSEQGKADRHAALHDVLTGLPNRALFCDRLEHAIAQAARHDWPLAVMFVDLDDFKTINDTHGHDVGDTVLCTIASRIKAGMRSDDTVSRLGGDEFLYLLMAVSDRDDVAAVATKIIATIQAPCEPKGPAAQLRFTVKASVGIATYPADGLTATDLIKQADAAMYQAKQTKSGFSFAS